MSVLERWLSQIRIANAFLLDQDTWERWGRTHASEHEIDERMARERQMIDQRDNATRELKALVATLRASSPDEITAWADAHDELLAGFIERYAKLDPSSAATAVEVAKQEREEWQAVKRGEKELVDENTFFITIDRDHYKRLFGIDP